ncbi:MAG: glucarate dehydratase, partial [Saprospiraceae bacterium]|nr:glucarate dehydratase [Saprospiraceae bacterium]
MNLASHQIKDIVVTPVAIPDPPLLNCAGVHAPYALRIILEVVTEGGITGISEIPGNEETELAINNLKPYLVGQDIFQTNQIFRAISDNYQEAQADERGKAPWDQRIVVHIFSAIEVACLDIIGKELNKPVVDLIGGKMREEVPFAAYLFYKYKGAGGAFGYDLDPAAEGWDVWRQAEATSQEGIINQAIAMCKAFGYKSIKLKGGAFPPEKEIEDLLAIGREFDGQMPLRFDPNATWSLDTGIKWAKVL